MINFILNGVTYTALENPDDGYRSSLDYVYISDAPVSNVFEGCEVKAVYENNRHDDIVTFTDIHTGLPVLEIGTEDIDDYYPGFTARFSPENMWVNVKRLK